MKTRRFPYAKTSPELRTSILGLQVLCGFEGSAALILLWVFVPGYWRYAAAAVLLGLYAYLFRGLWGLLQSSHVLSAEGLELRVGGRFHRRFLWEQIARVDRAQLPPPALTLGLHLRLDTVARTLFLVTGRVNLVELVLAEPLAVGLRGSTGFVDRIVFNVDEPAEFIAAAGQRPKERKPSEAAPGEPTRSEDASEPGAPADLPGIIFTAPAGWTPDFSRLSRKTNEAALRLEDVTRRYGDYVAVQRLTLAVRWGEIIGFVGPNGAGKTTTLKMMTGLLRPSAGRIEIAGHDVWQSPLAAKGAFGYVPDTPVFYERLTVREFLGFLADLRGLSARESRLRLDEALSFFELEGKADSLVRTLSLGNRRRLALAGTFLHRPPVLLLDEPTNGLDPRSARQVKDLLRQYRERGGTVFLTTHLLELAEQVCDRLALIHRGRLRALGTFAELQAMAGAAATESLEDVFLRLTEREAATL